MAEIKLPLASPPVVPNTAPPSAVDKDAHITRLDELLERYLHALDAYEKLRLRLSGQLSSAFISLAQANYHNSSGVPYGQDRYDERVQATRRIVVTEDSDDEGEVGVKFSATPGIATTDFRTATESPPARASSEQGVNEANTTNEKHDSTPNPPRTSSDAQDNPSAEDNDPQPAPTDPLRMFGILVPPALRTAQTAFSSAVAGPVVELAGVMAQLRALEREIGRVRKRVRRVQDGVTSV